MSDVVLVALIVAIGPMLTGVSAIIMAFVARAKARETDRKLQVLHLEVNSRMTELLEEAKAASGLAGEERGRKEGPVEVGLTIRPPESGSTDTDLTPPPDDDTLDS